MVREGVPRVRQMLISHGGWGWFSAYGERSYPHPTAVVVHGLINAGGRDVCAGTACQSG